jgi:hypothetical protein
MAILFCASAELLKKANNKIVAKVVLKKNFMGREKQNLSIAPTKNLLTVRANERTH